MSKFLDRFHGERILIADGATGTNLQNAGLAPGAHTEELIFDNPRKVLELEQAFVQAGSDIILTCTFGGSRLRMKGSRYARDVPELNLQAAHLAREAASSGKDVLVAGSMGPLGALLKPYGEITQEEAVTAYAEQASCLAGGGVDFLLIETQYSVQEATAAVQGTRSVTDLPVVVSFSYDRGTRTMMGTRPIDVVNAFVPLGVALIGANCGTTIENMASVLTEYRSATQTFPLWAKPNAGMPRIDGPSTVYDTTPLQMADFARAAAKLGARVIGGCCGSTPEHIAAMANALREIGDKASLGPSSATGTNNPDRLIPK